MLAATRVAVGTHPSDAAVSRVREWERTANNGRVPHAQRLSSPDSLPMLGIGYHVVSPDTPS